MRVLLLFSTALVFANPVIAAPAASPKSAGQAESRPSKAEALAFAKAYSPSDLRHDAEIRLLRSTFVPGLKKDPASAQMLEAFPELGDALTKAMEAQIGVYIAEHDERFFPRVSELVEQSLSRSDVQTLTAFYTSPVGRKALATAIANADAGELMDRTYEGKAVDEGVVNRQVFRAGMASYSKLTEQERKAVLDLAMSPTGQRFQALMPKIVAIQVELVNNPGPRFVAAAKSAMSEAFERVTGKAPVAK